MEPSESHATRIRSDRVRFRSLVSVLGPFWSRFGSGLAPFGVPLGPCWVRMGSVLGPCRCCRCCLEKKNPLVLPFDLDMEPSELICDPNSIPSGPLSLAWFRCRSVWDSFWVRFGPVFGPCWVRVGFVLCAWSARFANASASANASANSHANENLIRATNGMSIDR